MKKNTKHTKEECVNMAVLGWICAGLYLFMAASYAGGLLLLRILVGVVAVSNAIIWTARAVKNK